MKITPKIKKRLFLCIIAFAVLVWGIYTPHGKDRASGSWHYKMTVVVETPEGIKTGSAVREMSNATPFIDLPDASNPASVRGEAVVVDLGARGIMFALISHHSDNEFDNAFPLPGRDIGSGGSTPEGIRYYSNLPIGSKGAINPKRFPGYPKLVTFKDLSDPKSVTLVQDWRRDKRGLYYLAEDYMPVLFGEGVTLKEITIEITDEPVTWGIEKILPAFNEKYWDWVKSLNYGDPRKIGFSNFKTGANR